MDIPCNVKRFPSDFIDLFTPVQFAIYNYSQDLNMWLGFNYNNFTPIFDFDFQEFIFLIAGN